MVCPKGRAKKTLGDDVVFKINDTLKATLFQQRYMKTVNLKSKTRNEVARNW